MSLPALVPEAVVIVGVAAEVDVEPVPIGGALPVFEHVLEGPEAPAHVVEHAVQHHAYARLVQGVAHVSEVLVGAKARVYLPKVPGVIAVGVRLEHRGEVHRAGIELFKMGHPVYHLAYAALGFAVVLIGRAAEADGVYLVEHG